ncbi:hypothetical protein HZP25_17980 [Elizabethkingia anophelis]|nr:hypothetical protein [Elizabethkingia anophelis]
MKTEKYEVTKEQILEAHADACNEWKEKLEEWFPEVFEQKCEVGKWYWASEGSKREKSFLFCHTGNKITYGFGYHKGWSTGLYVGNKPNGVEATNEEVYELLVKEAKNRFPDDELKSRFIYRVKHNELITCTIIYRDSKVLFKNGKWLEIVEESNPVEVSKSDIAKLMNVEVSNLKIVD